jgi:hypothetical protein
LATHVPAVHTCDVVHSPSPLHGVGAFVFGTPLGGVLSTTLGGSGIMALGAQKFGLPAMHAESAAQSASE